MLGYFHCECSLFLNFIAKIERVNSFSAFKINRNVQRGVLLTFLLIVFLCSLFYISLQGKTNKTERIYDVCRIWKYWLYCQSFQENAAGLLGNVNFRLWNTVTEEPCCNIGVLVDGIPVKSDSIGVVSLFIPLERQKPCYGIKIANATQSDTLYMPCGDDDVILIE